MAVTEHVEPWRYTDNITEREFPTVVDADDCLVCTLCDDGIDRDEADNAMERNGLLIAQAPLLRRELIHIIRAIGPEIESGRLQVPGFATLNGARRAVALAYGMPDDVEATRYQP